MQEAPALSEASAFSDAETTQDPCHEYATTAGEQRLSVALGCTYAKTLYSAKVLCTGSLVRPGATEPS